MSVRFPTEFDPFLVQLIAAGAGEDLEGAMAAAHISLRKRASQVRKQWGFPLIHGMYYARTQLLERFAEPGSKSAITVTLSAWYHLDIVEKLMSPIPHSQVSNVPLGVIIEYDVVFCEGY
ncbi:MAG TPA: hypothetical protein VJU61_20190 [Polyangiaceae bacterium]|nr:hypothetical protein [Polyangiaceae bacterium]